MTRAPSRLARGVFVCIALTMTRPAAAAGPLHVVVSDGAGTFDADLTSALIGALADTGLAATSADTDSAFLCPGCISAAVHRTAPRRFVIEVRAGDKASRTSVELDANASSFDVAHALAIEVEMLTDDVRKTQRAAATRGRERAPRPSSPSSRPIALTSESVPGEAVSPAPKVSLPAPAVQVPTTQASPELATKPLPAPTPTETRLALSIGATTLIGTTGDLFVYGLAVGARVALGPRVDLRAGFSMLGPQRSSVDGVPFTREVRTIALSSTIRLPHFTRLRAGGGLESMYVITNEKDAAWSVGMVGKVEARYAIHNFALLAAAQAAYHPAGWRRAMATPESFLAPPWTVGATLGIEFRLF